MRTINVFVIAPSTNPQIILCTDVILIQMKTDMIVYECFYWYEQGRLTNKDKFVVMYMAVKYTILV